MAYGENGVVTRRDLTRIKLTRVNSQFISSNAVIQFFRWKANSANMVDTDTTPLQIMFFSNSTGEQVYNGNALRASDLAAYGSDISQFNMIIDTRDMNADYQVLKMATYLPSGSVVDVIDALIPEFSAHPTTYATDSYGSSRSTYLQNLHPFRTYTSTAPDVLAAEANRNYCFSTN